jgi:hypothetical protein
MAICHRNKISKKMPPLEKSETMDEVSDFTKKDSNQDWKQIYEIARSEKSARPQLFELPGITSKMAAP